MKTRIHLHILLMLALLFAPAIARARYYQPETGRFITMDEMLDNIETVTAESVREVACRFLKKENINLSVLGPIGDLKIKRADLAC